MSVLLTLVQWLFVAPLLLFSQEQTELKTTEGGYMHANIHICRERKSSFELLCFGMTGAPLGLTSSLRKEGRTTYFLSAILFKKKHLFFHFPQLLASHYEIMNQ